MDMKRDDEAIGIAESSNGTIKSLLYIRWCCQIFLSLRKFFCTHGFFFVSFLLAFCLLKLYDAENVNVTSILRISFGLGEKGIKLIGRS